MASLSKDCESSGVSETETADGLAADHYTRGGGGSGASIRDAGIRGDHATAWVDAVIALSTTKVVEVTATPQPAVSGQSGVLAGPRLFGI
jgi:hypothetical protein